MQPTVRMLLDDIELGRIVLPEVQREFVWSENDAKDLLDSLYRGYPIGYIFLWRPKEVKPRRYLQTQAQSTGKEPDYYLLDGQQRLTSLLKIKKGEIRVYFNLDTEEFHLENRAIQSNPKWFPVTEIWGSDTAQIASKLSKMLNMSLEEVYNKYVPRIIKLRQILDRELPAHEIREDDYAKIAEIYIRLNSKGVRLRKAELFLALAVLNVPIAFRSRLEALEKEFEDWGFDTSFFMRCFTCLATGTSKFETLSAYLREKPKEDILQTFNDLLECLRLTLETLETHLGLTPDKAQLILPSEIALIPLMVYLYRNRFVKTDLELSKLLYWFLMASFWGRYSGATETKLDEDLRALKQQDPIDEWIQSIKRERGRLLIDVEDIKGRVTANKLLMLYFLVQKNGAIDWFSPTDLKNTSKIELHHIFPKKVLRSFNFTDDEINDLRNIAFVSASGHRRVGSKEPADYIDSKGIDANRLRAQLIPLDNSLLRVGAYRDFLEKRGELIVTSLNDALSELYVFHEQELPIVQGPETGLDTSEDTLIDASPHILALLDKLMTALQWVSSDITRKDAKYWCVFKSIAKDRAFAYIHPRKRDMRIFPRLPYDQMLDTGLTIYRTPSTGSWAEDFGYWFRIQDESQIEHAITILKRAYEAL
ncbi:MAG: DUF262 domain-containing protein [Candidatus Caldarchaeum sp.]